MKTGRLFIIFAVLHGIRFIKIKEQNEQKKNVRTNVIVK